MKNRATEMKNVCNGLISWLNTAKERNNELEDSSKETFQTKRQRKNKNKTTKTEHPRTVDNIKKCIRNETGTTEGTKNKMR